MPGKNTQGFLTNNFLKNKIYMPDSADKHYQAFFIIISIIFLLLEYYTYFNYVNRYIIIPKYIKFRLQNHI